MPRRVRGVIGSIRGPVGGGGGHAFDRAGRREPLAIFVSNLVEFTAKLVTNALGTVIKERCSDWPALGSALTRHVCLVVSDRARQ